MGIDATYSVGKHPTGVGIYSLEILRSLAESHPDQRFRHLYRPHTWRRAAPAILPNVRRAIFGDRWLLPPTQPSLFHGLNQRMPALRIRRKVCTFHDLFVMTGDYSSPEFRRRFTQQAREAAERSDLIIAVSRSTASQVESLLHIEPSRIHVIHHGIRHLPLPGFARENIILNVGAIQHRKNITRLVRAFERLGREGTCVDWRLILAGAADGYGAAEALATIAQSPARDRIQVTGYLSTTALSELYARASVFAFPSLDEGFGMPVLEAMASGLAVVASDRSALPEVCGDAALLVNPESDDAVAEALRQLTDSQDLREKMVALGRKRAELFSWEKAASATWEVYQRLL
ncbi:MAG: glycosyltransferase family 4 protein [Bryobacteraceae bacterium]|nr:glycosyltransferase family 4 protein [Bryobacteraceae bacterium]